jgi:hypothetical protein
MPLSALLLAPLIALSLACAPVASATPEEQHCVRLKQAIDAADPNDTSLSFQKTIAEYQIHCLGTARPSALGQLVRTAQLADRPAHPAHPDHPDHPARP